MRGRRDIHAGTSVCECECVRCGEERHVDTSVSVRVCVLGTWRRYTQVCECDCVCVRCGEEKHIRRHECECVSMRVCVC